MRPGALKSFVQAFYSTPAAVKAPVSLPEFLIPLVQGPCLTRIQQPSNFTRPGQRRFASINKPHLRESDATKDLRGRPDVQLDGPHNMAPHRRGDIEAWATLLDRYLPHSLRVSVQKPRSSSEKEEPLPITAVPSILASARMTTKKDLLSYIGIFKERWEAVFWLVEAMLAVCPPYSILKRRSERLPMVLWDTQGQSLDDTTNNHIGIVRTKRSNVGLDYFLGKSPFGRARADVSEPRQILGELWQGLGCMILQSEDFPTSSPEREVIMAHALQILAYMHHSGALPDSIYNYGTAKGNTVLQRPPTLYLLSARIMSALSDVSWKSYWVGEMERAKSYGYELPLPKAHPQLPRVGAEVWLDLVLWACVEGGWISEAAWLVTQIEHRRSNANLRWSVISWDKVCSTRMKELDWKAGLKFQIDRTRLNQATGINIANLSTSNFYFDMGTRTISREVVLAIADGLVNTASIDNDFYGSPLWKVQHCLSSCQSLLERGQPDTDPGRTNALILRAMESSAIETKLQPTCLLRLLRLMPRRAQSRRSSLSVDSLINSSLPDFSAAVLGLLHRTLDGFARQANFVGSLQAFKFIQYVIDSNRDTYIQDFADELRRRLLGGSGSLDEVEPYQKRTTPMLYPEIPPYAVEAFLDLIVKSRNFDLGQWLFFNDDIDGGILSPSLFSETLLQPALLRFATATANDHLLMRVLENLETPLSQPILHALLRCQVAVNRWDAVEGILKHFRNTQGMAWTVGDAISIAAAIPALEWKGEKAHILQVLQAKGILQDLVQGEFHSPRNQAGVPDLQEVRMANQLGRIFQSVTGALSTISLGPEGYLGRAHYSVMIPADVFNILLGSVVECHGPLAGIKLWERWCLNPTKSGLSERSLVGFTDGGEGEERVVQPTPTTLRLILRSVTGDLEGTIHSMRARPESGNLPGQHMSKICGSFTQGDAEVRSTDFSMISRDLLSAFDWCMNMYRRFGFSNKEIDDEIPRPLQRIARRKQDFP